MTTAVHAKHRGPLTIGFIGTNTILLWLATAIASTALWSTYRSLQLVIVVIVGTLAGSTIAIVSARFRWSSFVTLLVTLVAYLLLGVPLALPDQALLRVVPTLQGLGDLVAATALSWKQLLTITLPVGSYQALLVPAFILVLASVTISLTTALRARRGELGVGGPVVLFLVAIMFGPGFATFPSLRSLGLFAATLLWLIWWRWHRRRESIRMLASRALDANGRSLETVTDTAFVGLRPLLSAGLIIAVAAGSAVALTNGLPPSGPRQVLRTAIQQPFDPQDYASPLSGFRHYELPATVDQTILSVTGLPAGGRIRIATLDTYDGIVYSVGNAAVSSDSGTFTRVPSTFDQSGVRGTKVTLGVTVGDYRGVWVPTIGKFENITFDGSDGSSLRDSFYYNNTSGTAAVLTPLAAGDAYTIDAIDPIQPSASQISQLTPGTAQVPRIGVVPDQLSASLDDWVRGTTGAGNQLEAMIATFKKKGYVSHGVSPSQPASRSGHAADRITELLTGQRMIGDQEQYSVAAALMARQLGFPARVVFGFAPTDIDTTGVTRIHGSDVSAWIEVDSAKYGWVTIDPTPPVRTIPEVQPQDPTRIARPQSPVQPPITAPNTAAAPAPPDTAQDPPAVLPAWLLILFIALKFLGIFAIVLAVVLAPFIVIVIAKLRRRRLRRRAPSPLQRITGGWDEYEDAVIDRGFDPPPSATRTEVATAIGGRRTLVLASIADRAVFSPSVPDADDAENVWRSVRELVATLDDDRGRWQRIRSAISVRSLGGYSVSKLFKR